MPLTPHLIEMILHLQVTNPAGLHGLSHWARVLANGQRLAEKTGADRQVIELFALFHDSRRLNEDADPQHGPRGAALAERLYRDGLLPLDHQVLQLLLAACRLHTSAPTHDDITVQTCFDADRLDLARIGITVDPKRLCTEAARDAQMIAWANGQSLAGIVPDNILSQTLRAFRHD